MYGVRSAFFGRLYDPEKLEQAGVELAAETEEDLEYE